MGGCMMGTRAMYEYAATAQAPKRWGGELGGKEDRRRTIRPADDSNGRRFFQAEADASGNEKRYVDTGLCRGTQKDQAGL